MSHSQYSNGLASSQIVGNVIQSEAVELRIIGRNPDSGNPPSGVPFSLDLEIETFRDWFRVIFLPFLAGYGKCPDAIVLARSANSGRIWAQAKMVTSMFENCRATTRLVFDRDFVPDSSNMVVFEVYTDNADLSNLTDDKLIDRSEPMPLDLDTEQGQQSGVYAPPTTPWYQVPGQRASGALDGVNTMLKRVTTVAGVAVGLYFLSPLLPGIRDGIANMAKGKEEL